MAQKVKMSLIGANGNAFYLLAIFRRNAKEQGWETEDINKVTNKAQNGDYDHLLRTLMENIDDEHNELDYHED